MDILQIFSPPPPPPPAPACPVPPKPFSSMGALGLTFVMAAIFNTFLRYVFIKTSEQGVHAAVIAIGVLIFFLCIGLYSMAAFSSQKRTPARPDPSSFEFATTIFFQCVVIAATYFAAKSLLRH